MHGNIAALRQPIIVGPEQVDFALSALDSALTRF